MDWTPTWVWRFQFQREMRLEAFHKKNLVKAQKIIQMIQSRINLYYKCLPKDTKDVLIPWPSYLKGRTEIRIWPWETSWRMWRSRMQRRCSHKSLSNQEQLEAVTEEVNNAEVVMDTLNDLPGSWNSFIQRMCSRRKWLLSADSGKKKKKLELIRREEKMEAIEDQALTIQSRSFNRWGI